MSVPRSVRFDEGVLARLDRYVREHPGSSSSVAKMLIDEALRSHEHPGVVFQSGPISNALRYYAAYPDEIDERITANREATEREEQLWHTEQNLLRRLAYLGNLAGEAL